MVNKAYTRWVAANLMSGHLIHAGNHRHGSAGHRQGQCSAQYAVVCEKPMAFGQGVVVKGANGPVLGSNAGQLCQLLLHPYTDTSAQECSLHL